MAGYNCTRAGFTPTATNNMVLQAPAAGNYCRVTKFSWGGELGTSTPARTRWVRATVLGTTFTNLNPTTGNPESGNVQSVARCTCGTFGTIATIPASPEGLFSISWNKNGGGGIFSMTQSDEEWDVINGITPGQQLVVAQDTDTSNNSMSCSLHWKEN